MTRSNARVRIWEERLWLPTYEPLPPDKNPMFLEKRVYQGSSGRVYPLPFTDRIAETPVMRAWRAVWIENEYLRVLVLPEIGGRVHAILDKTNGYDLIYRQAVIKPALVGLAGPWISGGIEFNWPQHHRPGTFLPVDVTTTHHPDGSATIWCGDHDPLARMKGLHGVCLHPGRAVVELKVRVSNRTPLMQTFLWWANAAVRVHEDYQSFFPPDVRFVADHARRALSAFPLCRGRYYGVDYAARARSRPPTSTPPPQIPRPANDLSWYANIPVPTSYMALGSAQDFFGGYDHRAQAGIVHIADHRIAPGKKQWTWGCHDFGRLWDRHLTDPDEHGQCAPYIELMAGVFSDNQPDFSFLHPGETKAWSQFWYPIQKIGPAHHANLEAAVSLRLESQRFRIGVSVTRDLGRAVVRLEGAHGVASWPTRLAPGKPFVIERPQPRRPWRIGRTTLRVLDDRGRQIIAYTPQRPGPVRIPPPATEPPPPASIASADELFLTGLHLDQYRHATRCPTPYWREALRRDPLDARCHHALGLWHLRRGEWARAETHFRRAIQRLTRRNANPADGEPFYNLGLTLRHLGREAEAYDAFFKATWNYAWQAASFHALAELDCRRADWPRALDHLQRALRLNADNGGARNLLVLVLRRLGRPAEAESLRRDTLALDPLDAWARHLGGEPLRCDTHTRLDIALDYARAGFFEEALAVLREARPEPFSGAAPLLGYYRGWLCEQRGDRRRARAHYRAAAAAPPDYCFPARLEEIAILQAALRARPRDARAAYYLGNLFYDRRRHAEAIALWERSARLDPAFSVVWRNLGIGYFNIRRQPDRARAAYERAWRLAPDDARLLFERDQLWKRLRVSPRRRRRELERRLELVRQRDDLSVELCALYNQAGRPEAALRILTTRRFQPWEGGEGRVLAEHTRARLALGQRALARGDARGAREHFERALQPPASLGEARHPLANASDIDYWLGEAARRHWRRAAAYRGDFREMKTQRFSETTYYVARALERLGRRAAARALWKGLLAHARRLGRTPAKLDYFATSLPRMLLFEDNLRRRQQTAARFLEAQARLGLGQRAAARRLLAGVLRREPDHGSAADLLSDLISGRGKRRSRAPTGKVRR